MSVERQQLELLRDAMRAEFANFDALTNCLIASKQTSLCVTLTAKRAIRRLHAGTSDFLASIDFAPPPLAAGGDDTAPGDAGECRRERVLEEC